ncbi:PIN domain-containing protein [Methanofollis sp. W23]|uniref:PIN domain-containing protein n=1 Tax=Methanofollis sp. W23 TaxID=2817849 RepID=UPI001AEB55AD|nr:PIN domain-containing protein [Methanofollis sp. W23]
MTKVFIDTNLFLGLYDAGEDFKTVMGEIERLKPDLILPETVLDEFLRNRDRLLGHHARELRRAASAVQDPPSFLESSPEAAVYEEASEGYVHALLALAQKVEAMITEKRDDPVWVAIEHLATDPEVRVIRWTGEHLGRAQSRKLVGNPPKNERGQTVGDEVIWEILLDEAKDDLIVITRDQTYRNHLSFLIHEFKQRTAHRLIVDDRISAALRATDREPSGALLMLEGEG